MCGQHYQLKQVHGQPSGCLGKNINENGGYWDTDFGTTSWPACGEIDIMEKGIFVNQPDKFIQSAIHTPSSSGNTVNKGGIIAGDVENDYHVYSLNWSPDELSFLIDESFFIPIIHPLKMQILGHLMRNNIFY